jgi:hypothetical protein
MDHIQNAVALALAEIAAANNRDEDRKFRPAAKSRLENSSLQP